MNRVVYISVIACSCVVGLILYLVISSPRRHLDRFLQEVATVHVGRTRLEDWRQQVERTHLPNLIETCYQPACTVSMRGQNTILHKLHLAPLSTIEASVGFKDGIATEINIWVEIDDAADIAGVMYPGTGATVHQSMAVLSCDQHYSMVLKQKGSRQWASIRMDPCVSVEDRKRALAINGGCLTKIGGCSKVETIIPQVFNHL